MDGLDEARAGGGRPRSGPFDQIRGSLRELEPHRVRISCRELDWLGNNDRTNLAKVVPGGELFSLRLEPLNVDEQKRIVEAEGRDRRSLLSSFSTLRIGVSKGFSRTPRPSHCSSRVVAENGDFPEGRTETFDEACRLLARELNDGPPSGRRASAYRRSWSRRPVTCARSALLSGSAGYSLPGAPELDGFVPVSILANDARRGPRVADATVHRGGRPPVHSGARQHRRVSRGSPPGTVGGRLGA